MSSDSWWLSFDASVEVDAFEFDGSGARSAIGPEQAGLDWSAIVLEEENMDVGAVEDMLINGTAEGEKGETCNAVDRSDSHSADMVSSFLATERHEDKDSAAGARTMREPQAPTPLGMLPRSSTKRKNVRRSSGTSRKNSAAHVPALVPWNGSGTMPLAYPFPPAGASGLQIPIMTASLVIAHETHWAQSQLALQYAACAQLYENSLRNYPHMSPGPVALQGSQRQTPMAMLEPYRHCFFSPTYHVHQQPQTKGQRKEKCTATTIPRHPDQGKQAEGAGRGGCSGSEEKGSGVRGKRRQLSTAENVHASTNVQSQQRVIAQVKACARAYECCQNCFA